MGKGGQNGHENRGPIQGLTECLVAPDLSLSLENTCDVNGLLFVYPGEA